MDDTFYLKQLRRMLELVGGEIDHAVADEILCEILTELGYADIVKAYENVKKWYA